MKTRRKTFLIGLIALLFSLNLAQAAEPETLLGVKLDYDKKEISIQVVSSGCTNKESFKLEYKNEQLSILRVKKDECKAMEEAIWITYSLKEAGIDPNMTFNITNKFIVNPFLAGIKK